jgi:hypothetical protein
VQIALYLIAFVVGVAAAWLCQMYLEPRRLAAKAEGGPAHRRAEIIATSSIIASFFAGLFATLVFLLWLI